MFSIAWCKSVQGKHKHVCACLWFWHLPRTLLLYTDAPQAMRNSHDCFLCLPGRRCDGHVIIPHPTPVPPQTHPGPLWHVSHRDTLARPFVPNPSFQPNLAFWFCCFLVLLDISMTCFGSFGFGLGFPWNPRPSRASPVAPARAVAPRAPRCWGRCPRGRR